MPLIGVCTTPIAAKANSGDGCSAWDLLSGIKQEFAWADVVEKGRLVALADAGRRSVE